MDTFRGADASPLGEPLAVSVDFEGGVLIADGTPGRIVRWTPASGGVTEFQRPSLQSGTGGFYPTDLAVKGFFVLAVDQPTRRILRFDNDGAYRDVLLNFEELQVGRRVSPYALAVDGSGRMAVTDVQNHQVLFFDAYLTLVLAFGNYGKFPGQLDTPLGVSFTSAGDIVVVDTGNRRVQIFSDGGTLRRVIPSGGESPLRRPRRALVTSDGRAFVADPGAGAVFVFDENGRFVRAIAPASVAGFSPTDVARTRDGRLFVTDENGRAVDVFEGF